MEQFRIRGLEPHFAYTSSSWQYLTDAIQRNFVITLMPSLSNLKIVARAHHVTPHQVMLAWTLRNGNILSIPKAGNVKHMKENIAAKNIKLTPDEIKLIDNDFPQPTEKKPLAMI